MPPEPKIFRMFLSMEVHVLLNPINIGLFCITTVMIPIEDFSHLRN